MSDWEKCIICEKMVEYYMEVIHGKIVCTECREAIIFQHFICGEWDKDFYKIKEVEEHIKMLYDWTKEKKKK